MVMVQAILHNSLKMIFCYSCILCVFNSLDKTNLIATQHSNCAILAFRRTSSETGIERFSKGSSPAEQHSEQDGCS